MRADQAAGAGADDAKVVMGLLNGWQDREEEERDGERKRELEMSCLIKSGREDKLLTWKETSACTFPAAWLLFLGEVAL